MKLTVHFLPLRTFFRGGQCYRLLAQTRIHTARLFNSSFAHEAAASPHFYSHLWSKQGRSPTSSLPRLNAFSTPSAPLTTIVDPSRPSLYYHLLPAPNPVSDYLPAYAVSLLHRPPKDPKCPAVMGWLPATADSEGEEEAGLGDFTENSNFIELLHRVIQQAIVDGTDERLKGEAMQLGEGWMHVNDDRNLPEMGRISNPSDIIASVRVEGGELLPETYSPMPTYRTCTTDGLTKLSEGLEQRLLDNLRRIEGATDG